MKLGVIRFQQNHFNSYNHVIRDNHILRGGPFSSTGVFTVPECLNQESIKKGITTSNTYYKPAAESSVLATLNIQTLGKMYFLHSMKKLCNFSKVFMEKTW